MAPRRGRGRPRTRQPIFVKVARTGGLVSEVLLDGGRTVEDALTAGDIDFDEDEKIRVNGKPADLDDNLRDGDVVTIAGKVSGG